MAHSPSLITSSFRSQTALWGLFTLLMTLSGAVNAETFTCHKNPDYFTKRCTVHPYAVTKIIDGKVEKGHLVGCQFKSYTCMGGTCRDNYGSETRPYSIEMEDFKEFCELLCHNPTCYDPSGWQ
jgi:hypothetical protein